jgi:N-methylhydantoinase B/oxoprolinase/acetone carboxylase alpha subunit
LGDPAERDPAALAADLRGGKLSPARARQQYGDAIVARVTPP